MHKLKKYLIGITIIIGIAVLWHLPRKIVVKEIICINKEGTCSERITTGLDHYRGKSLRESQSGIQEYLSHELIRESSFRYLYPSTLQITLVEAKPEFALGSLDESSFRLIDNAGYVLSTAESSPLPFATVSMELPAVGTKLDEKTLFGLRILLDLSKSYQITKGELTSDSLVIELPTSTRVLFPLEGERDVILGSFVLVMNQLNTVKNSTTMEKVALADKTVDLRYKNPVIR
jgi:hypothetical protein